MIPRRRLAVTFVPLLVTVAILAVGCSSSGSDGVRSGGSSTTSSTSAPSTTSAQDRGSDDAYAKLGPHPVGVHTFALADGRRVVAWYPAIKAAAEGPKEIFDIASLLSPDLQSKIPADLRPKYEINAHPGAKPDTADGPFPVVLFSHGYAGFPEQSADLTTHLASWGFVVVAPDHVERSLSGLLGTARTGVPPLKDPVVLSQSLDAAMADAKGADSPLHDLLDPSKVAVVGHSAGAGAAYAEASADPRIKAFISYSVSLGGPNTKPPPVPKVPGMVMMGTNDGVIPPKDSMRVYAGMRPPKYEVVIDGAGHLVFSDICLIGKDKGGLVALVKQAGLDLPADLLRLASDGCDAKSLDPTKAFPAIDHLSVAFLRHELGIDKEPVGLDPSVTKDFTGATVTLTADPG